MPSPAVVPVINTFRLTKIYRSGFRLKSVRALDSLDLQIEKGEIFGFLGPNGAGKTSLIKILMGLSKPTSGEATVFGESPRQARVKSRVGFLPETPYFYEYLTAAEFLRLSAGLSGIRGQEVAGRVGRLLRLVRMEHAANDQMRGFSRGMLQRIGIAQALINDPELVILDEPMGGLDPVGRKEFRDIIVDLREKGKTVFFSTHILSDVEMICDRVGIVISGRMVNVGRLSEILAEEVESIEIEIAGVTGKFRKVIDRVARHAIRSGDSLLLKVRNESDVDKVMAILREAGGGVRLKSLVPQRKTLEDYFMAQVGGPGGRDAAGHQGFEGN
jgi:ABC-2 type transport system ATP-binding protein